MDNTEKQYTIPDILESFKIIDGVYKREQIDAAINLKDQITPHLIKILENVLADPEKYAEDQNLYDHIYAAMLLGHFKETKAHKVIVDLFSLPGDLPDQIFGDMTTTDLPVILLNTCGGSVERIKSLILNNEADDYCRISACQALAYAVGEGHIPRAPVVELFGTLFTGQEADEVSDFWGLLAIVACDLYPEEIMDVIRQGYDDGLIMPGMIRYSDFEKAMALDKDKCLEKITIDLERHSLDDLHAAMSWWACFNEGSKTFSSSPSRVENPLFHGYSGQPSGRSEKNKKKAQKKKKKQAKASKKKNRR